VSVSGKDVAERAVKTDPLNVFRKDLSEQAIHFFFEQGKLVFDHIPYDCVIHCIVPMDEPVAETNDLRGVGDLLKGFLVTEGEPVACLPNYLKLLLSAGRPRPGIRACSDYRRYD